MFTLEELTVLASEVALSLHPILLKTIPVPLLTQIIIRLGSFSTLGSLLAKQSDWSHSWGSMDTIKVSLIAGLLNLVHIGSSYTSYLNLSAGSSIAIFYIYPFLNILAGVLFLNEKINWYTIPLVCIAFLGVILIAYDEDRLSKKKEGFTGKNVGFGISMALLAALTESIIFMFIKVSNQTSPFTNVLQLYPFGFILLGLYSIWNGFKDIKGSIKQILQIVGFNCGIGFIGYSLRFYAIPRTSTIVFSLLAFIGVLSGYMWGLIFANETPSLVSIIGSICIASSVGIHQFIK